MAPPQEPQLCVTLTHPLQEVPKSDTVPKTLQDLVACIHAELGPDGGLDSDHIDANRIIALMESYNSNAEDWEQYAMFDHSRAYTRNLVDDGNGKFNLMILAWSKGQQSPIHDHAGSHCVMKILDGKLKESLFDWPDMNDQDNVEAAEDGCDITSARKRDVCPKTGVCLKKQRETIYSADQVTYVHDKIGLHRISNPSSGRGAVSLHLYTPPYETCKTFEEQTGRARSSGKCSFYSVRGRRSI
ncbi:RmlC-like cupin domain-containing protein [Umbelopsis sp. PMI_123]|nr:RmlC-like cupin domain-containing protein [Umbelopsis sp. PMI_123]